MSIFFLPAALIIGLLLSVAVLHLRKQSTHTTPARRVAARPLSRHSHRISLARQRRRYQAKIRAMERQQMALIYLLWLQQQRVAEMRKLEAVTA